MPTEWEKNRGAKREAKTTGNVKNTGNHISLHNNEDTIFYYELLCTSHLISITAEKETV